MKEVIDPTSVNTLRLASGAQMPAAAFGTFHSDWAQTKMQQATAEAIRLGWRHIDTARLEKIVLELHPQRIGKAGVLEIFQILCARGFAYNTALSEGSVVCFEAVRQQAAEAGGVSVSSARA